MKLGIVLLNHKSSHLITGLYYNICSMIGIDREEWIFLIVDNSNDVEELNCIKEFMHDKPNVKLLLTCNKGYAHGNNHGMIYLYENKFEYCLIVNPDIIFKTPNVFNVLSKELRINNNSLVVGPKILDANGLTSSCFKEFSLISSIYQRKDIEVDTHKRKVYSTMGCCLFIDLDKIHSINYLDERTFLYREEIILAEKMKISNYIWIYTDEVVIVHNHIRKLATISSFIKHRMYEFESTEYYFSFYLKKSRMFLLAYRILFTLRSVVYFLKVFYLDKLLNKKIFGS
jgi:GT2 family glycosyltransferase